jgi:uncharacterized membrane protein YdbT with pleckstrin-like domain
MSSYVDETLTKGENVLLRGKIAPQKYWFNFLIAGTCLLTGLMALTVPSPPKGYDGPSPIGFLLVYVLIAVAFLIAPIMRIRTNELALTNKRVIAKVGIISLDAIEIKIEKVESVMVKQGIFGRLLNYGTIVVTGTGASHAVIPAISNPTIFKRQFASAMEELPAAAVPARA